MRLRRQLLGLNKDEGYSPLSLVNMIGRLARYEAGDMDRILHPSAMSVQELSRRLKTALEAADVPVSSLPPETAGAVFLKDGRIAIRPPTGASGRAPSS